MVFIITYWLLHFYVKKSQTQLKGIYFMAKKKEIRAVIRMKSTESDHVYYTEKNRRNDPSRMELRRFDPIVRHHVVYRETK
jgi:large subunit ribosomal protein L33